MKLLPTLTKIAAVIAFTLPLAPIRAGEKQVEWNGTLFRTYTVKPSDLELFWLGPDGKPFRQFIKLQKHLESQNKRLRFIMNGGLFEEDGSPCGLLVINGKTLRPLNMRDDVGNFYLKPNGVFYIDSRGAHIVSSEEYERRQPEARMAIQSGPLLLDGGMIHHAFRRDSKNALHRNGVGVMKDGAILFVITQFDQPKRVTLHEFSRFFLEQGCKNALFLDGDISMMFTDPQEDLIPGNYFGTIFAVTAPLDSPAKKP